MLKRHLFRLSAFHLLKNGQDHQHHQGQHASRETGDAKKNKREEYVSVSADLVNTIKAETYECEKMKDVQGVVSYFASIPDEQSNRFFENAIDQLPADCLKYCSDVLDPKCKKSNSGEGKLELAVKRLIGKQLRKLEEQEQKIGKLKSALVLSMMRHGVNVSLKSGKIDTKPIRDHIKKRLDMLTAQSSSSDVSMDNLAQMLGNTKL